MDTDTFNQHAKQIQQDGFTVLPGVLTAAECAEAQRALDRLFHEEPEQRLESSRWYVYDLMNKASIFERLYQLPSPLRLVQHFLGDDAVLSSVQAHVILPGTTKQELHADGSITGPNKAVAPADEGQRIVSHVLGLNLIFAISDFTQTNGSTRVVPGSHRIERHQVPTEAPGELIVESPRGSTLIFNMSTWHGYSEHRGDRPRYAVAMPWRRRWLRPEADLSRIVKPQVLERAGKHGRVIFGFAARSAYLEKSKWDFEQGRPLPAWRHLERD